MDVGLNVEYEIGRIMKKLYIFVIVITVKFNFCDRSKFKMYSYFRIYH